MDSMDEKGIKKNQFFLSIGSDLMSDFANLLFGMRDMDGNDG